MKYILVLLMVFSSSLLAQTAFGGCDSKDDECQNKQSEQDLVIEAGSNANSQKTLDEGTGNIVNQIFTASDKDLITEKGFACQKNLDCKVIDNEVNLWFKGSDQAYNASLGSQTYKSLIESKTCDSFDAKKGELCIDHLVGSCGEGSIAGCDANAKMKDFVRDSFNIEQDNIKEGISKSLMKSGKLLEDQKSIIPDNNFCVETLKNKKEIVESKLKTFSFKNRDYLNLNSCSELMSNYPESYKSSNEDASQKKLCNHYASLRDCNLEDGGSVANCFANTEDVKETLNNLVYSCFATQRVFKNITGAYENEQEMIGTVDSGGINPQTGQQMQGSPNSFGCIQTSGITLDYFSCKRAVSAYNAGLIGGDTLGNVAIGAAGQITNMDIQSDLVKDSVAGGKDAVSASNRAAKRKFETQSYQEYAKMGIQGTKGAIFLSQIGSYITPTKVTNEWCNNKHVTDKKLRVESLDACMLMVTLTSEGGDAEIFKQKHSLASGLFQNQYAIQKMSQNAGQSLSKALISGIVGSMLNKQAQMVGEVQNAWEQATFNEPQTGIGNAEYCQTYPNAPLCRGGSNTGTTQGGGLDVNFGGFNGANGEVAYENDGEVGEYDENGEPLSGKEADDLSNIMGDSGDGGVAGMEKQIAAGGVSSSKRPGGGGGGGGGAAGGGGGGGAGDSVGAGKGGARGAGASSVPRARFAAGGSGKYTAGAGGKKKGKDSNPFNNLLGNKPAGRNVASEVEKSLLPKNIKLFSAISKKYDQVNKEGRIKE